MIGWSAVYTDLWIHNFLSGLVVNFGGTVKHPSIEALVVVLLLTLTGCMGGKATSVSTGGTPTVSTTATRSTIVMPEVVGQTYSLAKSTVVAAGLSPEIMGKDGVVWCCSTPGPDVKVTATFPSAGTTTELKIVTLTVDRNEAEQKAADDAANAAKKAAEEAVIIAKKAAAEAAIAAQKLAVRYEFTCGSSYGSTPAPVFHSYREVWASKYYTASDTCTVTIDGKFWLDEPPQLLPSEQAIADVVAAYGGGNGGSPIYDFEAVLQLCAKPQYDYVDQVIARMDRKKAEAYGALALCPEAPHAAILQEVITSVKIDDGTKVVGKDMEPGTYRTKPGIKDCYWSRNTGGGDIIDNNFVGFAPDGVTVTVYPGEGFESSRCGVWTKIGQSGPNGLSFLFRTNSPASRWVWRKGDRLADTLSVSSFAGAGIPT